MTPNISENIPELKISEKDKVCAPGINFENGSCYTIDQLITMAEAYNKEFPNKPIKLYEGYEMINPKKYKKYLLHKFHTSLPKVESQKKWIEQNFMKHIRNKQIREELENYTFKPPKPEGDRYAWLSTLDIDDVMAQYEKIYDDFKFLGAVPIDFDDLTENDGLKVNIKRLNFTDLKKKGIRRIGIVFNTDPSTKSGQHWISAFADLVKGQIFFYDSAAVLPPKQVRYFLRRIAIYYIKQMNGKRPELAYNKIRHQYGDSECGVYSINFILRLLKGETFRQITESKLSDEEVNKCRDKYFA